jgi:hypothetical protein
VSTSSLGMFIKVCGLMGRDTGHEMYVCVPGTKGGGEKMLIEFVEIISLYWVICCCCM